MRRTTNLLLAAVCVVVTLTPAAQAGWMTFASSVLQAKKSQKHPETLSQMIIVRRDSPGAQICATYLNDSADKNKGRVVTSVGIVREDATINTLQFAGGVNQNSYVKCKPAGRLQEGDMVFFEFELKGMPLVKRNGFIEVNGVVTTAGQPPIERHGLMPSEGGWVHTANSVFLPEKNRQKHPTTLSRLVTVPRAVENPEACAAYMNTAKKRKAGRVVSSARVIREDGTQETLNFAGGVRDNSYLNCKPIGSLEAGDMVEFTHELKSMPRLARKSKKDRDLADVYSAVTTAGDPVFQSPPDGPEGPGGERNPGGGDNTPGGGLSSDDFAAACATLVANRKTQIQRPRGNNPAKYLVLGPRSTADSTGARADVRNTGVGNSIAEAAADYRRKTGDNALAGGCTLSSRDRAAIQWYHNMSSAAGPTAIRRDGGGGYHADFWRPWAHVIQGGFKSVADVVDFLIKNGL